MFTGLIQALGEIVEITRHADDISIQIDIGDLTNQTIKIGDSICVDGCCLTVIEFIAKVIRVDISAETLNKSLFAQYKPGQKVNLELAMLPQTRFGGHIVSGHVDGIARISGVEDIGRSKKISITVKKDIGQFIAIKGSITINGISLTINDVIDNASSTEFSVTIIPHTELKTTIGQLDTDSKVHVEIDMLARYVKRLLSFNQESGEKSDCKF